ncbi:Outer membrane receptor proteins, mostly Fe transport [Zhouia amylolytica]|uniref:Outer membrane receptor proteins, mostly Fe transport n=1 Tax=Zhouia amylolytica TaxID=376730 RepID=A0A1I6UXN4_9FLAO|nr:TonB-dependent receptor [Zhouia amylolytica]SFT06178.1 Outer membrane receptor proteins, mostly Fe transport [Zhouia amylolytica]
MRNFIVTFMLLTCIGLQSFGQPSPNAKIGSITGKVIDKTLNQPIPYASVVVKSKVDGSNITGGITNDEGVFELKNIEEGTHLFVVQFIGYQSFTKEITISRDNRKLELGTITLSENSIELEGVSVVGERTTIEQKIDRKVINIGKDLSTAGASASDIMNNLPSINVDQQTGNISMRGNENVRVMVDGKLSNIPVNQLLKQIPSTSIKSIELITNPSAKYNPEGMSGIINIILHKNANIGFNGNASVGLTYDENAKFNSALDLNYRNGKFNLYGNIGTNIGKNNNHGNIFRDVENSEQLFNFQDNNKSYLYKVGVDFYLNDKNTISFFTNQNIYDGKAKGNTNIIYNDDPTRNYFQNAYNKTDNHSQQYNFDYKLDFAKEGHNIELEVDYNTFESDSDFDFLYGGNTNLQNYSDFVGTDRTQLISNLDYVNPISENSKLEAGLEARLYESDIDYSSTGLTFNPDSGNLEATPDRNFIYNMDIYSAYVTFAHEYEKWAYQLGARAETVDVDADLNENRVYNDDYIQIYPSGFLTYTPTEKNQYQLSFSRRVDRPGLNQVNPFREWSTPQISSLGNPLLEPQFTNSIETNYTRRLKNGSITAGVFYRLIEDEINRAVYIDRVDTEKIILTFDNFDRTSAYGLEISSNYRPTKWWNFNASFDLYSQTQRSVTERSISPDENITIDEIITEEVKITNTPWNFRMNNNFKVTKILTLSLFGMYRSSAKGIQFETKPMYFVNTGARLSFAEGKGTLSLNYNDIFNTMRFAFEGENPYQQEGSFHWESQSVYLGLSYRFGSGKNRALSRKNRDDNTKDAGGGIL